jgi:hypothetical protein
VNFRLRFAAMCTAPAAIALFLIPSIAAGQQSYRTQHAMNPHSAPSAASTTNPRAKNAAPNLALRFRGWRDAAKHGPATTKHFQSMLRQVPATPHTRPGYSPVAAASAAASSTFAAASGTMPGVQLRPAFPAGALPTDIVTGDFNGDGKVDWAVANGGDDTIYIYLGKGDGTSQLPVIIPTLGDSPVAIAAGDINGDGKTDLLVVETDSGTIAVFLGNADRDRDRHSNGHRHRGPQ